MLKYKLNIALRNILRQKVNSAVIIISLALGFTYIFLISVFIHRELKTDSFQENREQIYALQSYDLWSTDNSRMYYTRNGSAEYIKDNFSQVEDFCRINPATPDKIVVTNKMYYDRPVTIKASSNFFTFFNYELITNNPEEALATKNSVVISESLAQKYFGKEDAVGKTILFVYRDSEDPMIVSGIFRKPKENSQLDFEMVKLIGDEDSPCYVRLKEGVSKEEMEAVLEANKKSIPALFPDKYSAYYLNSMKDAYFDVTRRRGYDVCRDKKDLKIAFIIGILVLGIASSNFLGLVNSKLERRKAQYMIRKVNGGSPLNFLVEFMTENIMLVVVSMFIAIFASTQVLPFFNTFSKSTINTGQILKLSNIILFIITVGIVLTVTYLFVSLRMSSSGFKKSVASAGKDSAKHKQLPVFTIFQLAASIALIIGSAVIMKQIHYISNKPIGLNRNVIEVKLPGQHANLAGIFKEELQKIPSVDQVSAADASPVLEHFLHYQWYLENGVQKEYLSTGFTGDENYISALGIEIIEGEGFTGNPDIDSRRCLVNETFAANFPEKNLIGDFLPGRTDQVVAGIVKDFHYSSLKAPIESAVISYRQGGSHLMVKPAENQDLQARNAIEKVWNSLITDYPLVTESINERYEWMHHENINYVKFIGACCFISIFLSMIGLFAISLQSSSLRIKEIGIRKVNGAKVNEILALLNSDYIKWILIAYMVITPVAWYAMNSWLEGFAYKTDLNWWIFAVSGLITVAVTLITVSGQSWQAANRNPVEALRYE